MAAEAGRTTLGIAALLAVSVLQVSRVEGAGPAKPRRTIQDIQIDVGRKLFTQVWPVRDPSQKQGDGLGPLFNERSCAACHKQGGLGGGGPSENNVQLVAIGNLPPADFWAKSVQAQREFLLPTATGDTFLLHKQGIHPAYAQWRRERLKLIEPADPLETERVQMLRIADLRQAGFAVPAKLEMRQVGTMISGVRVDQRPKLISFALEERNTTALFGAGLIDRIPVETLERLETEQPAETRGRFARLEGNRIGRFGWKGQNATLQEFNEGACAAELGLQTARKAQAKSPPFPSTPTWNPARYQNPAVDIDDAGLSALTAFTASLPAPGTAVREGAEENVLKGHELFQKIGCANCHRPDIADVRGIYSDLMLHRIGLQSRAISSYGGQIIMVPVVSNSNNRVGPARADEFRTPPLWGVADSAPYLHDGSAPTLEKAIEKHGDQGASSAIRFSTLPPEDHWRLLAFLKSLRAPHGN